MSTVLVIEDTQEVRRNIVEILTFEGYEVIDAEDGEVGVQLARERRPDVIICDIMMPKLDGYAVLHKLHQDPATVAIPIIFLTAKAAREDMRKGMALGADDYITKPFMAEELLDAVRIRLERRKAVSSRLFDEFLIRFKGAIVQQTDQVLEVDERERQEPISLPRFDNLIGADDQMQAVFSMLRAVADVDVPVLILGETGTGKELVARALHHTSRRHAKPFVSVNCAALPVELVESELFGHEKGAFTGAYQKRIGKVEMAQGGTLFLDEVAEMPVHLQAKLLRFLEEHTFVRIGGAEVLEADVRILAATNQDIEKAVSDSSLRMDLLYRLNTITVSLPPLRERMDDIPLLVDHFVEEANDQYGCAITGVDAKVYEVLGKYHWPGNVRELKNVIDRAAILAKKGKIMPKAIHLPVADVPSVGKGELIPSVSPQSGRPLMELKRELLEEFERSYIDHLLRQFHGNITRSAHAARIDKKNFIEKMQRYNIDRKEYLEKHR